MGSWKQLGRVGRKRGRRGREREVIRLPWSLRSSVDVDGENSFVFIVVVVFVRVLSENSVLKNLIV